MEDKNRDKPLTDKEIDELMSLSPQLQRQSYEQIQNLTLTSLEVMSRQATFNIGTIGHVAHGKSTLVRAVSTVNPIKFKNEKVRNITIRLGYANAKLYKCEVCPTPQCYQPHPSSMEDQPPCKICKEKMTLIRHISFVDCPGHDILMSTMLTGTAVMDAALLLIAANMQCPQPQTIEHLRAISIMNLRQILIIQNKVDIIFKDKDAAMKNFDQIKLFVKDFLMFCPPIIPCSAQLGYNIDAIVQYICEYFPMPKRNLFVPPKMIIIRSFDVNKPGQQANNLQGGVVGGSIIQGVLRVGDEVEIRPGQITKDANKKLVCKPLFSRIVELKTEDNHLLYAVPGGLIGVGLTLDPSITRQDRLIRNDKLMGNVLGYPNKLPDIFTQLEIEFFVLKRLIVKSLENEQIKVTKIVENETLKFNIGSTEIPGRVIGVLKEKMTVSLSSPICTSIGEKVAFCRSIRQKYRLIGWGDITNGVKIKI